MAKAMAIATKLGCIYVIGYLFEVKSKNQRCKVLHFENVIFSVCFFFSEMWRSMHLTLIMREQDKIMNCCRMKVSIYFLSLSHTNFFSYDYA